MCETYFVICWWLFGGRIYIPPLARTLSLPPPIVLPRISRDDLGELSLVWDRDVDRNMFIVSVAQQFVLMLYGHSRRALRAYNGLWVKAVFAFDVCYAT